MDNLIQNWETIKENLKNDYDISDIAFKTWISPLQIHEIKEDTLIIISSLQGSIDIIKKKYEIPLSVVITEFTGKEYTLKFIYPDDIDYYEKKEDPSENIEKIKANLANLDPKYTFDTFVVGKNNEFAHAAALAVAENPGELYNPLFIYGGVGLGKTHLMHSIAHYIISKNSDLNVLYVTSESFTNDLIDAIRIGKAGNSNSMTKFREKYRNVDVLLIDDIQFIIGKESTQEEFFHTFNALYSAKKAIIISSDKPPKDFDTLDERYKTRFEWGITADISSPDFETRMAILHKKEETDHLEKYHIPNEVMEYIANNVNTNIRELEGSFNRLLALAILQKKEINISLAMDALKDIINPKNKKEISPEIILDVVSDFCKISVDDILSPKRNAEIVIPRQIVMYLCRKLTSATYEDIGSLLGDRDHSTVKHGETSIKNAISTDKKIKELVDALVKKLTVN